MDRVLVTDMASCRFARMAVNCVLPKVIELNLLHTDFDWGYFMGMATCVPETPGIVRLLLLIHPSNHRRLVDVEQTAGSADEDTGFTEGNGE